MNEDNDKVKTALAESWHRDSAESSLERLLEISAREGWGDISEQLPSIVNVFGASWFFTRYIFFLGRDAISLIDSAQSMCFDLPEILNRLGGIDHRAEAEQRLDQLRLLKNGVMLQILVNYLRGISSQQQAERALTLLADATLIRMLEIFGLTLGSSHYHLSVLGMGRMAGYEMTFGSDLDLIFLYEDLSGDEGHILSRKIRLLLRHLAMASSSGSLYDVDMRLRPHGTSGALLTTMNSFIHHHSTEREIWERQGMTRCRTIIDQDDMGAGALAEISPYIFANYDEAFLRSEILYMRHRVQNEKGTESGKYNVKQGRGGLMDIDFITHYFQLCHGSSIIELQTCSTREALNILTWKGLLTTETSQDLLSHYDFLKRVEACIRLFDMKSVSAFPMQPERNRPLARAMGYGDDVEEFMEKYLSVTDGVRNYFTELVGDLRQ